jgi:hypothetical protein
MFDITQPIVGALSDGLKMHVLVSIDIMLAGQNKGKIRSSRPLPPNRLISLTSVLIPADT